MTVAALLTAGFLLSLLAAALCDLRRFEIPDLLSVLILALAVALGLHTPGFDWLGHGLAFAGVFAVGLLLFARGIMGGGDVKLIAASAAWLGPAGLPAFLAGMVLAGGLLAAVLLGARRAARAAGHADIDLPGALRHGAPLPYAVAIAAGGLWWAWRTGVFG